MTVNLAPEMLAASLKAYIDSAVQLGIAEALDKLREDLRGQDGGPGPRGPEGPAGKDGASIAGAVLKDGALILMLSDGREIDAGRVVGKDGRDGIDGKDGVGKDGRDGRDGIDGKDGVSVTKASLADGELMLVLSDGASLNVGKVVGADGKDGRDGIDGRDGAKGDTGIGIPGPEGPRGPVGEPKDGKDGKDGRDGRDGIGLPELKAAVDTEIKRLIETVEFDGERTFKFAGYTFTIPAEIYRGVFEQGTTYERGDNVTYSGNVWHCNGTTKIEPGKDDSWRLSVRKGRDGHDGKDVTKK